MTAVADRRAAVRQARLSDPSRRTRIEDLAEFATVAEVAACVGASPATVYGMVERGELRAVRFGRLLRIPRDALLALARRT